MATKSVESHQFSSNRLKIERITYFPDDRAQNNPQSRSLFCVGKKCLVCLTMVTAIKSSNWVRIPNYLPLHKQKLAHSIIQIQESWEKIHKLSFHIVIVPHAH